MAARNWRRTMVRARFGRARISSESSRQAGGDYFCFCAQFCCCCCCPAEGPVSTCLCVCACVPLQFPAAPGAKFYYRSCYLCTDGAAVISYCLICPLMSGMSMLALSVRVVPPPWDTICGHDDHRQAGLTAPSETIALSLSTLGHNNCSPCVYNLALFFKHTHIRTLHALCIFSWVQQLAEYQKVTWFSESRPPSCMARAFSIGAHPATMMTLEWCHPFSPCGSPMTHSPEVR